MQDNFLKDFNLVGGTALALHLGHRISEDIDLFTSNPYELSVLKKHIQKKYDADIYGETSIGIRCYINAIKTDFLNYPYPSIENSVVKEEIRMLQIPDIAAMKHQISRSALPSDRYHFGILQARGLLDSSHSA